MQGFANDGIIALNRLKNASFKLLSIIIAMQHTMQYDGRLLIFKTFQQYKCTSKIMYLCQYVSFSGLTQNEQKLYICFMAHKLWGLSGN